MRNKTCLRGLCLLVALWNTSAWAGVAVSGGKLYTMEGAEAAEGVTILVSDGVIEAIGVDLEIPFDYERVDARTSTISYLPATQWGWSLLLPQLLLILRSQRNFWMPAMMCWWKSRCASPLHRPRHLKTSPPRMDLFSVNQYLNDTILSLNTFRRTFLPTKCVALRVFGLAPHLPGRARKIRSLI